MLPEREINLLVNTVVEAVEMASVLHVTEGYARLHEGLRRAERELRAGAPWAEALLPRYEEALRNYVARYGASANTYLA
jgi:hypothetical protein